MWSLKTALALCALINIQRAVAVSIFQRLPSRTNQVGNNGLLDSVLNSGKPAGSSLIQRFFELSHQRGAVASYGVPPCERTQCWQSVGAVIRVKPAAHGLVNDLLLPTYQAPDFFPSPSFRYPPAITTPKVLATVPLTRNRLPVVAKATTFFSSRTQFSGSSLSLPTVAKSRFSLNRLPASTAPPTLRTKVAEGLRLTVPRPPSARTLPFFVQLPSSVSSGADLPRISPNTHNFSTYSYGFNVPKKPELPISTVQKGFQLELPRVHQQHPTNLPKVLAGNGWQRGQSAGLKLPFSSTAPTFAPGRSASLSNVQPSSTRTKLPESPVKQAATPRLLPILRKNVQFRPVLAAQPSRDLAIFNASNPQARKQNIVVATLKKGILQKSDATSAASLWGGQRPFDSYGDLVANGSEHVDQYVERDFGSEGLAQSESGRSDIPIESEQVVVPAQKQENSIGSVDLEAQSGNGLKTATVQDRGRRRKLVGVFKRPVTTPQSRPAILFSETNGLPSVQ